MSKKLVKEIENIAQKLPYKMQKIFFMIVIERMFCSYKKYSKGKMEEYIKYLNDVIEDYWDYFINGKKHDSIIMVIEYEEDYQEKYEYFEDEYGEYSEQYNNIEISQKSIKILSILVENIYYILPYLLEYDSAFLKENFEVSFDIIGTFIDYYYEEKLITHIEKCKSYAEYLDFFADFVTEHKLYYLECERVKRDIEYLQQETDLQKIYNHYRFELKETLFGDSWFNEGEQQAIKPKMIPEQIKREWSPDFFDKYGYTYEELSRCNQSIAYYSKILAFKPDDEKAYNGRAYTYKHLKEYEKAIADLDKSIKIKPDYIDAYYNRADNYYYLGKNQKAIDDLSKIIELKPDAMKAYYNRAYSYDELGEYQKAIDDLTKAIELKPDFAESYCNRGNSYIKLGEYQKAIDDLTKAIELKPNIVESYCNRGESYYKLGEYQKAISDYSKAIEKDTSNKENYLNRAKIYRLIGEIEKAILDEVEAKK